VYMSFVLHVLVRRHALATGVGTRGSLVKESCTAHVFTNKKSQKIIRLSRRRIEFGTNALSAFAV
jgi:hypothetical protein